MSPLDFIGTPYWLSAVLALAYAAPWLLLLAGRWLRRRWLWGVLVAGAVAFPLSIAWIQVPIQQAIGRFFTETLAPQTINRYALLVGLPSIIVSGLVQETVKFAIAVAGMRLARVLRSPRGGLAFGAASGAGYGAMEAFWVFNTIFAAGFTWGTVQLGGIQALLGFIERFFAVMFHIGAASLSAYGAATGRPWRYLLLAIGLHALTNYMVLVLRVGALSVNGMEVIVSCIAVATLAAALWLRWSRRRPLGEPY
jgi:uncharacterized membrane protein YhfC